MPRFGAHLSIAGGVSCAVRRARDLRADCLQLFLKSPSQWRFAALPEEEVHRFRAEAKKAGLRPLVGHASYLVNLASPDDALYERSRRCILEEWDRAERLGLDGLILHPGAHMGSGAAAGLARIAIALDWLRGKRPRHRCRILLETTAGAGTVMCGRLEHLRYLVQECDPSCAQGGGNREPAAGDRKDFWLGVAIDTCHLFAAGYDLRTAAAIDDTLGKLDAAVGLERVLVVHANDAKAALGCGLDRHAHIGRGKLGREAFRLLVNHPALAALPFILETPKHDARGRQMDPVNLRILRSLVDL
jgi:deoxyribonuclease-4